MNSSAYLACCPRVPCRGIVVATFFLLSLLCVSADVEQINALKQLSLDELVKVRIDTVVGASKHEEKITDAPANVTILTAEEIKLYGWRTLGDALRSVNGLLVTYDRSYGYAGIRGFNSPGDYSGRVLMNVDGHRMNDAMYDTAAMDTDFPLDLDLIDRIEVIRGPSSTLYGNNAFFGVINVITRRSKQINGTELSGSYGSFDTYTGRATFGHQFTNGVGLVLSGTWYDSAGNENLRYPEFAAVNNGVAHNMDDGWARQLFGSLSWKDWILEAGYSDRFKRIPTAQFNSPDAEIVFNNLAFRTIDERAFADLKFHHSFEEDWDLTVRAYYDHYRYDGWYPYHYNPSDPMDATTANYDLDSAESVGTEVQIGKKLFEKHHVVAGAEARYDYQLKLFNEDLNPQSTYLDQNRDGYFVGAYIEDQYRVLDNLQLTAGARYDRFKTAGNAVSPRAALVWHPARPSTLKFLYGQAYRAPNAFEMYYNWPLPADTPALGPETIRTYELECEQELNRFWNAKVALFYNELKNTISGSGNNGFLNLESATTKGIEAETSAHWDNGLQGRLSYAFMDSRDEATGQRLPNAPEHQVKLNFAAPVWRENIFASTELQLVSRRDTVNGGRVNGYWIANAGLFSRELVRNLEISVHVYNLFNQRYADPASVDFIQPAIEQNGRTFRVKLTWRF